MSFDANLVIERVSVIDVRDGTIQADQDVFIEGTRIVAIVPTRTHDVPESGRVIEATGQFLIPGLWDFACSFSREQGLAFPCDGRARNYRRAGVILNGVYLDRSALDRIVAAGVQ